MGSRSMAVFVETEDLRVLIDPGAGLDENRFGLSPHGLETWQLGKHWERIGLYAELADTVILTHYHPVHHGMDSLALYRGKQLFVKNPNRAISVDGRRNAFLFLEKIRGISGEVTYADGRTHEAGGTTLAFSESVPHGSHTHEDHVIQVAVRSQDRVFCFCADVHGFSDPASMDFVISQDPDFLYLDGPETYRLPEPDPKHVLRQSLERIDHVIRSTRIVRLLLDHHLLRDTAWKSRIEPLRDTVTRRSLILQTAAEYRGEDNRLLEANRRRLYEGETL